MSAVCLRFHYLLFMKTHFYQDIQSLLSNPRSPQLQPFPFNYPQDVINHYLKLPVLVLGAGGLGCQILKNLSMNGFTNIHVVDLDTIQLTNLNRQFLFRQKDVGHFKAKVAAEKIMAQRPQCIVKPYCCRIQQIPRQIFKQFKIVLSGLDNVQARRWMNSLIFDQIERNQQTVCQQSVKIMIDGGTQSFAGQARVIIPFQSACYQCTLSTIPTKQSYNMCTIANSPRIPQHCIMYSLEIQFPKLGRQFSKQRQEDIQALFEFSKQRGHKFGIEGINKSMVLQTVSRIIPAIASTNAIIAGLMVLQAFKLLTGCGKVNNYIYATCNRGCQLSNLIIQKNQSCIICNKNKIVIKISKDDTLEQLLKILSNPPFMLQKKLSIVDVQGKVVYAWYLQGEQNKMGMKLRQISNNTCFSINNKQIISSLIMELDFL